MPRQSQKFTREIAAKAEKEFNKIGEGKLARQLLAIMAFEDNSAKQVAKIFKVSVRTVFRWIDKFIECGVDGLKDKPKGHYPSKLTDAQWEQVRSWIVNRKNTRNEPVHWTLKKIRHEILSIFDVEITIPALSKNLKKRGLTLKKPRPVHYKADKAAQEAFKKNS